MATQTPLPLLDEVAATMGRIAPFLVEHVVPIVDWASGKSWTGEELGPSGVRQRTIGRPDAATHPVVLAFWVTQVPPPAFPGPLAKELFSTAAALVSTWRFCARAEPRAFMEWLLDHSEPPTDAETRKQVLARCDKHRRLLDDSERRTAFLELDKALRATRRALECAREKGDSARRLPICLDRAGLQAEERELAEVERALCAILARGDGEDRAREDDAARSPRMWQRLVAARGAALNAAGLPHASVAAIFPGSEVGSLASSAGKLAQERARARTNRARPT